MTRARPALLVAALLAGCGVKAPPRPPAKEAAPAAAAAQACETCGARAPDPTPRTP